MNNLKVGVEVVGAHDLVPKDGQGSASAYVELKFDNQKFRTTTKEKDLNPVWNETFYFNVSDPQSLPSLTLEASVYNHVKGNNAAKPFLGKVCLTGASFHPYADSMVFHYPLEKRHFLSRIKGELGLRVWLTDDPSVQASNPLPAFEDNLQNFVPDLFSDKKSDLRNTFRSIAGSASDQKSVPVAMKAESRAPKVVNMFASGPSSQQPDFTLKETSPSLGGGKVVGGRVIPGNSRPTSTYDLVEKMQYLFVRVVKANLPSMDLTGSLDPFVEVKIGNYYGETNKLMKRSDPEWNQVFAFAKENIQSTVLEVVVKDKGMILDGFVGKVKFDLHEVPTRVPPDSPLAPEWYRLAEKDGAKLEKGEIMLAVWYGTQADEAFPDAWHSDTIAPMESAPSAVTHFRSKVYHAPRLWYVRVKIIEAQDLVSSSDNGRLPNALVKLQLGSQIAKTKASGALNPKWDEEMMFVAAEPFDEPLIISIEDCLSHGKEECIGKDVLYLNKVEKRADDRKIRPMWLFLKKSVSEAIEENEKREDKKKDKLATRVHVMICLDGGYHVFDSSTHYSSDLRPSAKQLWKSSIGVLELGILGADSLQPKKTRDGRSCCDAYCVARYGHKWIRTRTIVNTLAPKFNEQYTWEVYDPATVLTIGIFDNSHISGSGAEQDSKIGKVRIRISTLQTGRVYTHSYPLLVVQPSGVKKMGELHLAIRFWCSNLTNMMFKYSRPVLPKMHYVLPLPSRQQEFLRYNAIKIVTARLSRAEPPLRPEVVDYMSDTQSHFWSMRRSKANFQRLTAVFSPLLAAAQWFGVVCSWKNPITTLLVHALFLMLVSFPELIFPTVFLYMVLIGIWNYRFRPKHPPHMNASYQETVSLDELDEEFDEFPTKRSMDVVRNRYDRLRTVGRKIQEVMGDVATQGERFHSLLSWRDSRATVIFIIFCLLAALVFYVTPFQVLVFFGGCWVMRHPKFRHKTPPISVNFFRRLPARTDSML